MQYSKDSFLLLIKVGRNAQENFNSVNECIFNENSGDGNARVLSKQDSFLLLIKVGRNAQENFTRKMSVFYIKTVVMVMRE